MFIAVASNGERVALKILLGDMARKDRRARYEREVSIGKRLSHPGIVRVFAHGEHDGMAYLVMELLVGARTLDEYAREEGLSPSERVKLVVNVAEALQVAHSDGVIHRDLKPDNVLVTPDGRARLVDFGLARDLDRERVTQSGAVMGTVHYMPPEQASGRTAHADERADVYALGVILFQLLSGELPYDGDTGVEILTRIVNGPVPDLRQKLADAPRGLPEVVAMAMAKDPHDRYRSAQALARDLQSVVSGSGWSSVALRRRTDARRKGLLKVLGGVLVVVLLGIGVALAIRHTSATLAPGELDAAAKELHSRAAERLAKPGLLAPDRPQVQALQAELDDLRARADPKRESRPLERATLRIRGLSGLAALADGDRVSAAAIHSELRSADNPTALALAGALKASGSDAAEAEGLLRRALARGIKRADVKAWHALAMVRAGPLTERAAREVLADLEAVAEARGALLPSEQPLRVRALLTSGERGIDRAEAALEELEAPPVDLRWHVALARAAALLETDPPEVLRRLRQLPSQARPDPERRTVAQRVVQIAQGLLQQAGELQRRHEPTIELERQVIPFLHLHLLLVPDEPLPAELVSAVLDQAADFSHRGRLDLALTLADLMPDSLEVNHTVAELIQRGSIALEDRRRLFAVSERAIALEPDPERRKTKEVLLCRGLAEVVDRHNVIYDAKLGDRCLDLANRLIPRLDAFPKRKAEVLACRGRILRMTGDLDGSLRDLDAALELHPTGPDHASYRAKTHEARGQLLQALRDYSAYHLNSVDHTDRLSRAGVRVWDLTLQLEQPVTDRLVRTVEVLLDHNESWGGWLVRGAWAQLKLGDVSGAKKSLERASPMFAEREELQPMAELLEALRNVVAELGVGAVDDAWRLVQELERRRGGGQTP